MLEIAHGVRRGCKLQFKCTLDPDTFAAVRRRAIKDKTSMAEQVRRLVEWGLESAAVESRSPQ